MNRYKTIRSKNGRISFLIDKKALRISLILLLTAAIVFLISTGVGETMINPIDVFQTLIGNGTAYHELIIQSFRLPRIIVSFLVGACLAVAGGILQSLVRNPLASPDIIGITGGASVAVVVFLMLFSDQNNSLMVSIHWMPLAAFIGAVITGFSVYFLARKKTTSALRLVLIGIGVSMFMKSLTTLFMIKGPIYQATQANVWITGSVSAANWDQVTILLPAAVVLLLVTAMVTKQLDILDLGDGIATGVGSNVKLSRLLLLLLSIGLTAVGVAFAGGIGFVGLMAPHMARRLVGTGFAPLLPVAALLGGILVMLADFAGKTLFLPLEVPAGVFTAAIGAPYFIFLLYKSRNA
ncbi:iron ABC transporter permease [Halobacillus sp. ACCC02827]|uniref:FecCD family ABC transporter permease n=1 Tax=Bacillaceae TaxID=186817 RepID=UPI0002A4FA39|nr:MULTISPECIES: iron ABC transporter permease [Bacillaceae]ELK48523.1 siderophore ABC transporter permease YfhA [Halobacillus sp. BAB-2008]QHT47904.1 iron ABC transporter permease [Bacillus sp. SB49]WJE15139.1 iron ABC transporter permease [Halobacillus sp. ACCC02827]